MLNPNFNENINQILFGNSLVLSDYQIRYRDNRIYYRDTEFVAFSEYLKIGRQNFITQVSDGAGNLTTYINGVSETNIANTQIIFKYILSNLDVLSYSGLISFIKLQSGALTAQQVADEYALLRSLYPEIESVDIGTQTWATRNFEAVATPMGNVIYNMNASAKTTILSEINLLDGWMGATMIDANTFSTTGTGGATKAMLTIGKKYKLTWDISSSTSILVQNSSTGGVNILTSGKWFTALTETLYIRNNEAATTDVNLFVLE